MLLRPLPMVLSSHYLSFIGEVHFLQRRRVRFFAPRKGKPPSEFVFTNIHRGNAARNAHFRSDHPGPISHRLASMVQAVNALGAPRPLAISLDGNTVGLLCSTGLLASDLGSRQRVQVIPTGAIAARWQVTVKGAEGRSGVVCGEVIQALRCSCINLSVLLPLPSESMAREAPGSSGTHLRERGTTDCLLDLHMPISHGMKLIQRIDPC